MIIDFLFMTFATKLEAFFRKWKSGLFAFVTGDGTVIINILQSFKSFTPFVKKIFFAFINSLELASLVMSFFFLIEKFFFYLNQIL